MTAFSSDWLALREPIDRAARNGGVLAAVAAAFAGRGEVAIADLACGTGSNLRALAPVLSVPRQRWTLVDHDPELLGAARERLSAWADRVDVGDEVLVLHKGTTAIEVVVREETLTAGLECVRDVPLDLVTSSAFFDLVSPAWISGFVTDLAARRLPLYAALTFDGREEWSPAHSGWTEVHRAFLAHQRRDKGFGPAAGSEAPRLLEEALRQAGYSGVVAGPSPWRLGRERRHLLTELANGIARAAAEQSAVAPAGPWAEFITEAAERGDARATIGHVDVWSGLRGTL